MQPKYKIILSLSSVLKIDNQVFATPSSHKDTEPTTFLIGYTDQFFSPVIDYHHLFEQVFQKQMHHCVENHQTIDQLLTDSSPIKRLYAKQYYERIDVKQEGHE